MMGYNKKSVFLRRHFLDDMFIGKCVAMVVEW